MPQEMRTVVSINNINLEVAYIDVGSSQQPLLCLHGIQGCKESYEALLASSLVAQARVIIPDIPGFGSSQAPADGSFDLERQAERLAGFVDSLKIPQLAIYGHSLGGMLGTLLLEMIPDRISGLISSEGNLTLADCGESRRVAEMSFDEFKLVRFPELQKRGIRTDAWGFYATAKSVVQIAESERLLAIFSRAPCPILFIRGGTSHFATVPTGSRVQNVLIPNESHFTLSESRASFEAIESFLSSVNA